MREKYINEQEFLRILSHNLDYYVTMTPEQVLDEVQDALENCDCVYMYPADTKRASTPW